MQYSTHLYIYFNRDIVSGFLRQGLNRLAIFMRFYFSKCIVLIACVCLISGCATAPRRLHETKRDGVYHKVQKNETLWNIAKAYGVPLSEIIDTNRIPDANRIEVGQLIFIPNRTKNINIDLGEIASKYETFVWPIKGKIVSHFGSLKHASTNKGIDIEGRYDQDVVASRSGKVSFCSESMTGYGRTIIIDHGDGIQTVYSYNSVNLVKVGDSVKQNQLIAKVGKGGRAVTPSLHFEIRKNHQPQNPFYYLP